MSLALDQVETAHVGAIEPQRVRDRLVEALGRALRLADLLRELVEQPSFTGDPARHEPVHLAHRGIRQRLGARRISLRLKARGPLRRPGPSGRFAYLGGARVPALAGLALAFPALLGDEVLLADEREEAPRTRR